ncbi:glycine cleavage system aminomethyltransferase GcvT [Sphingomonas xanthus]|uniref:aminomethyltransferase n=1 Tax=Sphingomonas xanthus TaxID=2594473 RepID=A0A516ITL5_9SPHN|nr:glycine cleavage system aminomethyltransferase GcvT [Sphingomonas xanthus]QDP20174.1 glycine cleavage system aminomethyltransferase GcvT [Sphingomonas xanthus]
MTESTDNLATLPLDGWHRARGARMVPFAGYDMAVQYEGIMAEHLWTRNHAGLFDVSHMGQLLLTGTGVAEALETLLPGDIIGLKPGRIRYSLLLDDKGGVIDDLMVTNVTPEGGDEAYYMVVNGATKYGDIADLEERLPARVKLEHLTDRALLALQGPEAAAVIDSLFPGVGDALSFMQGTSRDWEGVALGFGRSGYTGEDGFELSVPATHAEKLANLLIADQRVRPIGLGARDSLRLEAGLPLYGHDLDCDTTPVMAGLTFAIAKRRREQGGFAGAERILGQLADGPPQKRVGLLVEGRQPVREGALVLDREGNEIGRVTSGGHSPSLGRPIAMAYVATALAEEGTALTLEQRGKLFQASVTPMPFVPHRYHRKQGAA